MDRPDVYNDLRTGLAGDELKKVYYEETVTVEGNTIVVKTEAWYNQKVTRAGPLLWSVDVSLQSCTTNTCAFTAAAHFGGDCVVWHWAHRVCDLPAGPGLVDVWQRRTAPGVGPH